MLHEMLIEDETLSKGLIRKRSFTNHHRLFGLTIFFFTLHIPSFPKLFTVGVLGVAIPLSSAD